MKCERRISTKLWKGVRLTFYLAFVFLFLLCFPAASFAEGSDQPPLAGTTVDGTTPDGTTPDGTTPDGTTPDGTTPDGTTPDGTTPDGTTPNGTTPNGTTPKGTTDSIARNGDDTQTATPVLEDNGEVESEEDYSVPAGSATLKINDAEIGEVYANDTENNAIVNALNGAVTYLQTSIPQSEDGNVHIDIVVTAGTYEGGLDLSEGSDLQTALREAIAKYLGEDPTQDGGDGTGEPIANDIESLLFSKEDHQYPYGYINIVTEQYAAGEVSDGSASMEGDVLVDGFDMLLAGLYFANQERIKVENAQRFAYEGTALDDNVCIETDNVTEVTVDTKGGDDRVDLQVTQVPASSVGINNADAATIWDIIDAIVDIGGSVVDEGAAAQIQERAEALAAAIKAQVDTIVADIQDRPTTTVSVYTGDGADQVAVRLMNATDFYSGDSGTIDPRTGKPYAQYNFDIDLGGTQLVVDLGAGEDSVELSGGVSMLLGRNLLKTFSQMIAEQFAGSTPAGSSYTIIGGTGDDTVTLNTTAAFADFFGLDVTIVEEENGGYDRLHLEGELATEYIYNEDSGVASSVPYSERLYVIEDGLGMLAQASVSISAGAMDGVLDPVLDMLALQQTLRVHYTDELEAVTDLLENKQVLDLTSLGYTGSGAQTISIAGTDFTDYILPLTDSVTVASLTLQMDGTPFLSNLIIAANDRVEIGTLLASGLTVFLLAPEIAVNGKVQGNHVVLLAQAEDPSGLDDPTKITVEDGLGEDLEYGIDAYDVKAEAKVILGPDAEIVATGLVDVLAEVSQTRGMWEVLRGQQDHSSNFIVTKLPTTLVEIQGSITAGGFVHALAETYVDFDTEELLAYIPLAFALAMADTQLLLTGDAMIDAGAGAVLRTDSQVYVSAVDVGTFFKIALSLSGAIVTAETKTVVTDAASVTADGDVVLDARSRVNVEAASIAGPTDIAAEGAKSGVFVGVSIVAAETGVYVGDYDDHKDSSASVTSRNGDIIAEADGLLRNKTYSVSSPVSVYMDESGSPGQVQQSDQTISPVSVITLVETVVGKRSTGVSGLRASLVSKITGSNSLGSLFNNGAAEEGAAFDAPPSTQAVGALAIAVADNAVEARIDTTGRVSANSGTVALRSYGETASRSRADGSLYNSSTIAFIPGYGRFQITKEATNTAAGIAACIAVTNHTATAEIVDGTIVSGRALDVSALNRTVDSSAISKSGHIPSTGKLMLAGAITVHVAAIRSTARLNAAAEYCLGNGADVTVLSKIFDSTLETVADASGKRVRKSLAGMPMEPALTYSSDSIGVGAGIAAGVTGVDVIAEIADGVTFRSLDGNLLADAALGNVTVSAYYQGGERVYAAAGASGGASATPVSATGVSGVYVLANVGESTQRLGSAADVSISAQNKISRFLTADAAAAGAKVGMGAAVGVAVVNDSAEAYLKRKVKAAGNLVVAADSVSRMTETIKASVMGTPPSPSAGTSSGSTTAPSASDSESDGLLSGDTEPSGKTNSSDDESLKQADKTADEKLKNGEELSKNVNTKNTNADKVAASSAKRSSFSTLEGSIQVAAGIAVNIQSNLSHAEIFDGCDVEAGNDLTVLARNDTDAVVKSNASATNSYIGVGASVGVNVVEHQNIARVGDGKLKAEGDLTVKAEIYEKAQSDALQNAYDILIDYLIREGGLDAVIDSVGDTALKTSAAYRFLNEKDDLEALAQAVREMIDLALWQEDLKEDEQVKVGDVVVEGAGQRTLREVIEDLIIARFESGDESLNMDHAYGLEQYVIAALVEHYTGVENPYAGYDTAYGYGAYTADLVDDIVTMMTYTAEKTVLGYELMPLILQLAANENYSLTDEQKQNLNEYLGVLTQDEEGNPLDEAEVAKDRFERAKAAEELMLDEIKASLTGDANVASQNASLYADALGDLITGVTSAFAKAENWKPTFDWNNGIIRVDILEAMQQELLQLNLGLENIYDALTELLSAKFGSHS